MPEASHVYRKIVYVIMRPQLGSYVLGVSVSSFSLERLCESLCDFFCVSSVVNFFHFLIGTLAHCLISIVPHCRSQKRIPKKLSYEHKHGNLK
ncbi:hypothetical protein SAMN05216323_105123 [Williamwhitmania taraxaci]|uniref:Uncharacterized protein n=1 Tax=Williamwhitmania taraxaci TaxID=1640674 RepID=A0A1G6PH58_9BACT|nr:hypothetical protein SAMN05216323_105123 [Williamwhitmania taraxaci]